MQTSETQKLQTKFPFQPDLENLREETDGLKNVFGGERLVGKLDTHGAE